MKQILWRDVVDCVHQCHYRTCIRKALPSGRLRATAMTIWPTHLTHFHLKSYTIIKLIFPLVVALTGRHRKEDTQFKFIFICIPFQMFPSARGKLSLSCDAMTWPRHDNVALKRWQTNGNVCQLFRNLAFVHLMDVFFRIVSYRRGDSN